MTTLRCDPGYYAGYAPGYHNAAIHCLSGSIWPPIQASGNDLAINAYQFGINRSSNGSASAMDIQITRFDTSAIPANATVTAARLNLYVDAVGSANNCRVGGQYRVTSSATFSADIQNDWTNTIGYTGVSVCDAFSGLQPYSGGYNVVNLNGLNNINKGSGANTVIRLGWYDSVDPHSTQTAYFDCLSVKNAYAQSPYLEVDYCLPDPKAFFMLF